MPPPLGLQPPPGLAQHRAQGFPSPISHEPMFPMGFRPGPTGLDIADSHRAQWCLQDSTTPPRIRSL
jgi:hypothetical protein